MPDTFLKFDNHHLSQPKNERLSVSSTAINCTSKSEQLQLIAASRSVSEYLTAAMSSNSRKAYQSDLAHFINWGGTVPSTSEILSEYLAAHASMLSPATLSRRIVSISRAHTSQCLDSPTKSDLVKTTMRGIRRLVGISQRQASPILKNYLIEMVQELTGVKVIRDRALLLVGFAGALRRSELVGLQYADIEFVDHGLVVHLKRSKTDQESQGRKIAVPYARGDACPVLSLKHWLEMSHIKEGAIFRPVTRHGIIDSKALSTQAVAVIVKERVMAIGLDATQFSGHSLRAGLVTSAAQAGVSSWKIKQQTGHKSDAMLNRYIRDAQIFIDNAAGALL